VINAQEAAGLDIVTDGDSRFDLAVAASLGSSTRSSASPASAAIAILARLDAAPRAQARQDPVGSPGGLPAGVVTEKARARPARIRRDLAGGAAPLQQAGQVRRDLRPGLGPMLWDEHYHDDKALVLDLCDIMNAEFKELAAAGCPVIQVEEPRHHSLTTLPDCKDSDLEWHTEAFTAS